MKIDQKGGVFSEGPVLRSGSIKSLRPGDLVRVSVIERVNRYTAVVDLKGNPVSLSFREPVPSAKDFPLIFKSSSGGVLHFEMKKPSVPDAAASLRSAFPFIPFPDKIQSASVLRELRFGDSGLFGIMKALAGSSFERTRDFEKIGRKLAAAGLTKDLPLLTGFLSGLSEREISLFASLFGKDDGFFSDSFNDIRKAEDSFLADMLRDFEGAAHPAHSFISFFDEGELRTAEFVRGEGFFAGSFDFVAVGKIEFILRGRESFCSAVLCCDGAYFQDFASGGKDLLQALESRYDRAVLEIIRRSDMREKILAMAGLINNNALDVTV